MVLVGIFTEKDLTEGKDKIAIEQKMKETGLNYIQSKFIKKNGKIVGMKVWVCSVNEAF